MEKTDALQIHCFSENNVYFVEIKGEMSFSDISIFQKKMEMVLTAKEPSVIMDFSNLNYISSAGLRVLLKLNKDLTHIKKQLVLFGFNQFVEDVFQVSGFNKIFNIQKDKESAVQSILKT